MESHVHVTICLFDCEMFVVICIMFRKHYVHIYISQFEWRNYTDAMTLSILAVWLIHNILVNEVHQLG